jgi:hypothetical protein
LGAPVTARSADDLERRGATDLAGELILFGSDDYPGWPSVMWHLRPLAGQQCQPEGGPRADRLGHERLQTDEGRRVACDSRLLSRHPPRLVDGERDGPPLA